MTATGRPVRFWYDGKAVEGLEGETLAAALAASGIREMRHTRGGERRGLYCGMGACFDCLVTVDGRASQRACLTKVAEGQQVRSATLVRQARWLARPSTVTRQSKQAPMPQ